MNEDELSDFLFDTLESGTIDFTTGIPITPIRLFIRLFKWLDESNVTHQRAASTAVKRYIDYNHLTTFFDYNKF